MNIKSRIEELISSVHSCSTADGVKEIEALYADKKKQLGSAITPMADIRVRDAIKGKLQTFADMDTERKEMAAAKEKELKDAELAAKMDEGMHFVSEKDFFNHDTAVDECAIDAAVVMTVGGELVTNGHVELYRMLEDAADHVGGRSHVLFGKEYVNGTESYLGESTEYTKQESPYKLVESMLKDGVTRLFVMVEDEMMPTWRHVGQHFLNEGGHRVEFVEIRNKVPSSVVVDFIKEDDFTQFVENMPFGLADAERIYEGKLEKLYECS